MSNCRRNADLPEFNVLVTSLFYLMTRYASAPSPSLAEAIAEHFQMLRHHPEGNHEAIASAGRRLSQTWITKAQDTNLVERRAVRPGGAHTVH